MKKIAASRALIALLAVVVSVVAVSGATYAQSKSGSNTRPGWGHGDTNHEHSGPPGQSVRPDDDKDDDHGNNSGHDSKDDKKDDKKSNNSGRN